MKVGLLGEAPNDTKSIENLLKDKYSDLEFVELLKNKFRGSGLENQKTKTELRIECITHRPDIVIFIRDLDGLDTAEYRIKKLQRKKYFDDFKGCTQVKKTILLLHIWEIEALILSDIDAFNKFYKINVEFSNNPMDIEEPKELLHKLHNKYSESDNSSIFLESDFDKIYNNCDYFKKFIDEFETLLN